MSSLNPNQRPSRGTTSDHHLLTSSSASSSSSSSSSTNVHNSRRKWSNFLPLFLVVVFVAEISFLGRLDLAKNADLLNSWTESFYQFPKSSYSSDSGDTANEDSIVRVSGDGGESCEEWLERVDSVAYSRDFKKEPVHVTGVVSCEDPWFVGQHIKERKEVWSAAVGCEVSVFPAGRLVWEAMREERREAGDREKKRREKRVGWMVSGGIGGGWAYGRPVTVVNSVSFFLGAYCTEREWRSCAVECKFGFDNKKADATFGLPNVAVTAGVLRSMESAQYYPENNIALARRKGYNIIMTTSLSSDVPVGYFSWAEYDIMGPVQPKSEKALAAAFISNCAARNFRLQALEGLEKSNIKIDSYGGCHRNRDGNVNKVEALKRYKFSLAFENSNEEDYVTEKFFQSLVAGSIPVVVGAPNIQDFAPAPGSILHIKDLKDIELIAKTMKHLAEDPIAYNESLRQANLFII
ncbi:hypothetical protein E3N88_18294 [Mikania micrantha]|uniref:Fucosyltransferase n=1 Tax=Mikania micrantha TaxID=192012 RepID=A0A5N6NX06_9ASTR|nr:hypothetical protein E3N88_18294 [Mikania micrantha]